MLVNSCKWKDVGNSSDCNRKTGLPCQGLGAGPVLQRSTIYYICSLKPGGSPISLGVMADVCHISWPERGELVPKMNLYAQSCCKRMLMYAFRGNGDVSYFAIKWFQHTPHWSPYAALEQSALKSPSLGHNKWVWGEAEHSLSWLGRLSPGQDGAFLYTWCFHWHQWGFGAWIQRHTWGWQEAGAGV